MLWLNIEDVAEYESPDGGFTRVWVVEFCDYQSVVAMGNPYGGILLLEYTPSA